MEINFNELKPGMIGRGIEVTFVQDGVQATAGGTLSNYVKDVVVERTGEPGKGWLIIHIGEANGGRENEQIEEEEIIGLVVA